MYSLVWQALVYLESFHVPHLSLSLLVSLFVLLSLVCLCGGCSPVVVMLASVLQHDLAPRDIEEMLEVG